MSSLMYMGSPLGSGSAPVSSALSVREHHRRRESVHPRRECLPARWTKWHLCALPDPGRSIPHHMYNNRYAHHAGAEILFCVARDELTCLQLEFTALAAILRITLSEATMCVHGRADTP